MGNEDKVNGQNPEQKGSKLESSFLPSEVPNPEGKKTPYLLEEEFPKTRHNRSLFVYGLVALFIALIIGGTWVLTSYIQSRDKVTNVNISDFEDINLSQLLDQYKEDEAKLKQTRSDLKSLRAEMNRRIRQARTAEMREKIRAQYQKKIQSKRQKAQKLESRIEKHNKKMQSEGRKAESVVNNYEKLHRYKMEKQRKKYERKMRQLEQKYNPSFRRRTVRSAVLYGLRLHSKEMELKEYQKVLAKEGIATEQDFDIMRNRIKYYDSIMERMHKIPYKNSVPRALKGLDYLNREIILQYEQLWYDLAQSVRRKRHEIATYRYALNSMLRTRSESGVVLNASNPQRIRLYMNRRYQIEEGNIGYIFRSDDVFIGTVQFFKRHGLIYARQQKVESGRKIRPFDKVLLKIGSTSEMPQKPKVEQQQEDPQEDKDNGNG